MIETTNRPELLTLWAEEIHDWARSKGFYDRELLSNGHSLNPITNTSMPAEKLMLIVSECAEVLETLRDDDKQHEAEELADVVIRCLDYAGWRGIDIGAEIQKKMDKNLNRPYLHGRTL